MFLRTQAAELIVSDLIGAERPTQKPSGTSASLPLLISKGEFPFEQRLLILMANFFKSTCETITFYESGHSLPYCSFETAVEVTYHHQK